MNTNYRSQKASPPRRWWSALGQGTIEYALMLIFTGVGLVLVTGAAYTGMGNRVETVLCNVGNEGREEITCEEVAVNPDDPGDPQGPDDPDDPQIPQDPSTPQPPIAAFLCLCNGFDCYLNGEASYDQDEAGSSIVSYEWDFGADIETGMTVEKTYIVEGSHAVSLLVTDNEGTQAMTMDTCEVSLSMEPPVADFTWNNPADTLDVNFDGDPSYDQDEAGNFITRWQWDVFNDGTIDMEGELASYAFDEGGSYPVRLVVTDDEGDTAQTVKEVTLGMGPVVMAAGTCEGLVASFNASESYDRDNQDAPNNGITAWLWDFNTGTKNGQQYYNGVSADHQSPTNVVFTEYGDHTVTLTVSDSDTNTATTTVDIFCGNESPSVQGIDLVLVADGPGVNDTSTSALDPEDDPMTAVWSGLPNWVISGASLAADNTTLVYDVAAPAGSEGEYSGQVCVNDGYNEDVCATVTVTVLANEIPDITVTDYELAEGDTMTDTLQFAWDGDEDANLLVYYENLPVFVAQSDMGTQIVSDQERGQHLRMNLQYDLAPGNDDAGVYSVMACATDSMAETCREFTITVTERALECPPFPDFDSYPPGTNLGEIDFPGVTIYSMHKNDDNNMGFRINHPVWTYDSTERGEDSDLGTPNRAFTWIDENGNERYGVGDANHNRQRDGQFNNNWAATVVGGPYVNDEPLGNVIIIQEDINRAPDDNSRGGRIVFEFDYPAEVGTIRFVDVDEGRAAEVKMFDASGVQIGQGTSPTDAGENTVVPLELNQNNISRMEVRFEGSGAIDAIFFCDQATQNEEPQPPANQPPVCEAAYVSADLWPPNHRMVPVSILGVTDADGDDVSIIIDSIFQDERTDELGDGSFSPDATGVGTANAEIRAERAGHRGGNNATDGNGRVYHIGFTATDSEGNICTGTATTGVPHDQGGRSEPIDDGALFDSTQVSAPEVAAVSAEIQTVNVNNQQGQFRIKLVNEGNTAVSDLSMRLYFRRDGRVGGNSYRIDSYWEQSGGMTISGPFRENGRTWYFELDYGSMELAAGQSWQFNGTMRLNGWSSDFDGSNDHWLTVQSNGSFAETDYLPIYIADELAFGQEP